MVHPISNWTFDTETNVAHSKLHIPQKSQLAKPNVTFYVFAGTLYAKDDI